MLLNHKKKCRVTAYTNMGYSYSYSYEIEYYTLQEWKTAFLKRWGNFHSEASNASARDYRIVKDYVYRGTSVEHILDLITENTRWVIAYQLTCNREEIF